jgi:hypothetical protein
MPLVLALKGSESYGTRGVGRRTGRCARGALRTTAGGVALAAGTKLPWAAGEVSQPVGSSFL